MKICQVVKIRLLPGSNSIKIVEFLLPGMKKQAFLSKSAVGTQKYAAKIAEDLLMEKSRKKALILALTGELGGGKTTFVQGLAKALGVKEKITSPTFVIMRRFKVSDKRLPASLGVKFANFYHLDCYRIEKPSELRELLKSDFNRVFTDSKNLIVIEWAEKVKSLMPKNTVWLKFEWFGENQRKIYKF